MSFTSSLAALVPLVHFTPAPAHDRGSVRAHGVSPGNGESGQEPWVLEVDGRRQYEGVGVLDGEVALAVVPRPAQIARGVLQREIPFAMGLLAGVAGALAAGRVPAGLLYEVSPRDPPNDCGGKRCVACGVTGSLTRPGGQSAPPPWRD